MFYPKKRYKSFCFYFYAIFLSLIACYTYGQDNDIVNSLPNESTIESNVLLPAAVPVLTPDEALKANDEAQKEYNARIAIRKRQQAIYVFKFFTYILIGLLLVFFFAFLCRNRKFSSILLKCYKSPLGMMFYSTRFCRWDWVAMLFLFGVTFFFSLLAGQKAMLNGYLGSLWWPEHAARTALSYYNDKEYLFPVPEQDSELDYFLTKGSKGDLNYSNISFEKTLSPKYVLVPNESNANFYFASPGVPWLMLIWWKLIGNPDWSTLYILFSIIYGLIQLVAYSALRQVSGLIPSLFLGIVFSLYPATMQLGLFDFRDAIRAFSCLMGISILIYQLKGPFNWKGTIICSIFLLFICSLSGIFRNDFIVFIPFIVVATLFFHGKLLSGYPKKIVIIASIILGFIFAATIPRYHDRFSFSHVLYIGIADYPYMDNLFFSSKNYTKGIAYTDRYGWIVGTALAYRDNKTINVKWHSKEYDKTLKKEILSLLQMYPYDFLRLALSSSLQSFNAGEKMANDHKYYNNIYSAPGFWLMQKMSNDFYLKSPPWLCYLLLLGALILLLGGRFFESLIFFLSIIALSGSYMFQFHFRHYFYFMIIPLLATGFLFNRIIRIIFLFYQNPKTLLHICFAKRKSFLMHCCIFFALFALSFIFLYCSKVFQEHQIQKEVVAFNNATTESIPFQQRTTVSSIHNDLSATELLFSDFYNDSLARVDSEQTFCTSFIKVAFRIKDINPNEAIQLFPKYQNTSEYSISPDTIAQIVHSTMTCPILMTFFSQSELNTVVLPIYYGRNKSPLVGLEIVSGDKSIEVVSVDNIIDSQHIHTQSAFLIPSQPNEMQYAGTIEWNKVFWGDKK